MYRTPNFDLVTLVDVVSAWKLWSEDEREGVF